MPRGRRSREPSGTDQELNPGDRVEGLGNFGKPTEEFGTVEQANEDDAIVKWDDDGCISSTNRGSRRFSPEQRECLMKSEAVSLPVIAGVPLDCSFWPEDDGWSGVCERLLVIVRGSSFEDAKKHMETALQEHIERILREHLGRSAQWVS